MEDYAIREISQPAYRSQAPSRKEMQNLAAEFVEKLGQLTSHTKKPHQEVADKLKWPIMAKTMSEWHSALERLGQLEKTDYELILEEYEQLMLYSAKGSAEALALALSGPSWIALNWSGHLSVPEMPSEVQKIAKGIIDSKVSA